MPASYVTSALLGNGDFASQVEGTLDFGSASDRFILVFAWAPSGSPAEGYVDNCKIDPSGANIDVPMEVESLGGDVSGGQVGRIAVFALAGSSVPTGSKVVRVTADAGVTRLQAVVYIGSGAPSLSAGSWFSAAGDPLSTSVTSTSTNDLAVLLGFADLSGASAETVGSGATNLRVGSGVAAHGRYIAADEAGTNGTVTLEIDPSNYSFTAIFFGRKWNVVGSGGASQDLAGAAAAVATATGSMSHGVPLAGSASGVATASGNLSVTHYGVLTTPPLKNNAGTLLANETGATVHVYSMAGGLIVTKTGQTTDASGVMQITDPALVAAVEYRGVVVLASGASGLFKLTSV